MAELTVNPTEQTEGLTPEEQESLEIGERMQQEQDQLLAGKYQSPEELEKAYLELQKQFSSREDSPNNETESEEDVEDEEDEDEEEVDLSLLNRLWEEAVNGEYTDETLAALKEKGSNDIAQMYLQYRAEQEKNNAPTLSEDNAVQLRQMVGGDEAYTDMMRWAGQNLKPEEAQMYDAVMESGNALAAYWAVQALAFRYGDEVGREGAMLSGRPSPDRADVFRSQAELQRAMQDPRYDSDPAYREDVFEKLAASDIDF